MADKRLSTKQEAFIAAYLKSFNATEAARHAGYSIPHVSGSENLQKSEIKRRINDHLEQIRQDGIGNRATRLAQLNDLNDDLIAIQVARATEATTRIESGEELPAGAERGLLVETKKQVGKFTETIWAIDAALVRERQNILEQAAKEVGDRDKRLVELSGPEGAPIQVENAKAKLLELIETK